MAGPRYRIRPARRGDLESLLAMQERSVRALASRFYAPRVIDCLLRHMGTMDPEVIDEGHYFVAEADDGRVAGSGGWSRRAPSYDGGTGRATVVDLRAEDQALMRSVFVDPEWARQGIASAVVRRIEATAAAAGVRRIGLLAALSGVPLYRALGYRVLGAARHECCDGVVVESVEMAKRLRGAPTPRSKRAAA